MKKGIAEILKEVSELQGRINKIEALKKQSDNITLLRIIALCFDPKVVWDLPEGAPPYKPLPKAHDAQGVLYAESRRLPLFIKGVNNNVKQVKREQLFTQMLESLDPEDAALLVAVKDKKMPYKGITLHVVKSAFPDLAKDW